MVGEKTLTLMYKPHESKFRPSSAVAQIPTWLLMKFGTVEQVLPVTVTVLTDNLSNTLYQIPNSVFLLFKKIFFFQFINSLKTYKKHLSYNQVIALEKLQECSKS